MKANLIVAVSLWLLLCGAATAADTTATLTVTKISDAADGVCDADCSLREAVVAASSGDTIVFSPLFNQPQTITLTGGQIFINKSLTIAGPNADLLTVSGNNASRIFNISSGAVVALSGMKLTNGRATTINDCFGGAIRLTDSRLTLTNTVLSQNEASFVVTGNPTLQTGFGGAVYSYNSIIAVIDSSITDNFSYNGGGIHSRLGTVSIINSTVSNNTGGGGVTSSSLSGVGASVSVINSTFSGNSGVALSGVGERLSVINSTISGNGGGIVNGDSQAILTIDRSIISNNSSFNAGGIGNQGTATISNTAINGNGSSNDGGGIFNTGTVSVINSAVTNNSAFRSGGGIFNALGQLFLTNSTVSRNTAGSGSNSQGGGIYNTSSGFPTGGSITITNSTIASNRATGRGGGLRQESAGTVIMRNTIVSGNLSPTNEIDVSGAIVSQGFNLIGFTLGSSGWISSDLLNLNPRLTPLGYNGGLTLTHALMQGSPAINAGSNALARDPTTNLQLIRDQRGYSRISGVGASNIVDIGAYELTFLSSPVSVNGRVTTLGGRGIYNARVTLTDANGTVLYARTNPSGYYRFLDLPPGMNYTITVSHKTYQFAVPRVALIDGDRGDLNFAASQ